MPITDPKAIPMLGTDAHLPPVPLDWLQPDELRQRLHGQPTDVPMSTAENEPSARQQAAVLMPLVMRDAVSVLLTQRPTHMRTHAGQIAFPGGKMDETDVNVVATALREAQEEVGLPAECVEVLGTLPRFGMRPGFYVTPVVALVTPVFVPQPNALEVADVFEVPLAFLMNPANHQRYRSEVDGHWREWYAMPYQDGARERFIWGASALMLRHLYQRLMHRNVNI